MKPCPIKLSIGKKRSEAAFCCPFPYRVSIYEESLGTWVAEGTEKIGSRKGRVCGKRWKNFSRMRANILSPPLPKFSFALRLSLACPRSSQPHPPRFPVDPAVRRAPVREITIKIADPCRSIHTKDCFMNLREIYPGKT